MKVFVTGGAGFLGSHICEFYARKGAEVVAYDNLTKHELIRTGYDVNGARDYMVQELTRMGVDLVVGDIRDPGKMWQAAKGATHIAHCAAQPAMTIALEQPGFDADVNIMGTINVLELAKGLKVPLVNCSTIHVYGNGINEELKETSRAYHFRALGRLIDETEPVLTGTLTPLHASKFATETYTRVYAESYGVRAATFRLTGMYGPRQFGGEDHGWVANFAIRTLLGLPITVYKTDKQVRDILYVTDVVNAFDRFLTGDASPGIYNICGGTQTFTTLGEVLAHLARMARREQNISVKPGRQGDLLWFAGDWMRAHEAFGWFPRVTVRRGLMSLVEWIEDNIALFKKGE